MLVPEILQSPIRYRSDQGGAEISSKMWNIKQTVRVSAIDSSMQQSATQPPQRAAQGSLAELTKLTRNVTSTKSTMVSLDVNSHKVWCNATFGQETAPELTGMLPEAEVCFNLSPGGLFPLHSNNCYTWICSISDNQASANLEYCWTIQVFSSLLTGSCRLKAYYSYLRLKGSHSRKLVELTSLI